MNETITQRIDEVTNLKNAHRYSVADEKFLFCIELLEISAWNVFADLSLIHI